MVAGCGVLSNNPRPDDPAAVRPNQPQQSLSWTALAWDDVTGEKPPHTSHEQWDRPEAVAHGPDGFVAVGSNGDVLHYIGRIWRSDDGLDWKLIQTPQLDGLELVDVAATGSGFLAIGTRSSSPNDPIAILLASADAKAWTEVQRVPGAWAKSVASGPSGYVVSMEAGDATDLILSKDGAKWTRVAASSIGPADTNIADIAADGDGWVAAATVNDRAAVLRSADGLTWTEEELPDAKPVPGIAKVSAYKILPGRWGTLLLGLDSPACDDTDWCPHYEAAWSWTPSTGWARLPKANRLVGMGWGVEAYLGGEAGLLAWDGNQAMVSPDGWDWQTIKSSSLPEAEWVTDSVVVDGLIVAVGSPLGGDKLDSWFGRAIVAH